MRIAHAGTGDHGSFREPGALDFPTFCTIIKRAGGLEAWYYAFQKRIQKTAEDMSALDVLAMAACYSPEPELAPFPFRLPFDLETCERLPDVWERWQGNDPVRMVEDLQIPAGAALPQVALL